MKSSKDNNQVELMPAAVNSQPLNGVIGVKYGKPKQEPFTAERKNGIWTLYLPDRVLYEARGNQETQGIVMDNVDEFHVLAGLASPDVLEDLGYKYMMTGPERLRSSTFCQRTEHLKTFSDSGGFQLSKGVSEFIHPDKLADFYGKRIDYGIGLDVPLPLHLQSTDWFLRMCRVMLKNNSYINKRLRGTGAELYDVSHGLTFENRKRFLAKVLDHKVGVGLSLGGIGQSVYDTVNTSVVTAVVNICYVMDTSKGVYTRYHILGTTAPFMQAMYHILFAHGLADVITADSSTYAQGSISYATRAVQFSQDHKIPMFLLPNQKLSYGLPCNCRVCSMVGYPMAYRMSQASNITHNLYIVRREFELVKEATQLFMQGQIKLPEFLRKVEPKTNMHPILSTLTHFVMDMDKGFDKAFAKYRDRIELAIRKEKSSSAGLFGKSNSTVPAGLLRVGEHVKKVIERYENFHGIGSGKRGKS